MPSKVPPTMKLADLKARAALAKKVIRAIDIAPKDGKPQEEEVKRIRVRDDFATRNLVTAAIRNASIPRDELADVESVHGAIDQAVRSATRAAGSDGVIEEAEWRDASNLANLLGIFAGKHSDSTLKTFNIRPFEKPGTPEWVRAAQLDYFNPKDDGFPRFGTALTLGRDELPSRVTKAYDALRREVPQGKIEATKSEINGQRVFYAHVISPDYRRVDARIIMPDGKVVAKGIAKAPATGSQWNNWKISW